MSGLTQTNYDTTNLIQLPQNILRCENDIEEWVNEDEQNKLKDGDIISLIVNCAKEEVDRE